MTGEGLHPASRALGEPRHPSRMISALSVSAIALLASRSLHPAAKAGEADAYEYKAPVSVLATPWGEAKGQLAYVDECCGVENADAFGVDPWGDIYVADTGRPTGAVMMKYSRRGEFTGSFPLVAGGPEQIRFDSRGNLVLCASEFIAKIRPTGETVFLNRYGNWRERRYLREFVMVGDAIICRLNSGEYVQLADDGRERDYGNSQRLDRWLKARDLGRSALFDDPGPVIEHEVLVIGEAVLSRSIARLREIQMALARGRALDYSPYDCSRAAAVDAVVRREGAHIHFLGLDGQLDSFWELYDRLGHRWIVVAFSKAGRLLGWIHSLTVGDRLQTSVHPAIDSHGNVYVMQRWRSKRKGIRVFKYERLW